jgi:hypothetical protein
MKRKWEELTTDLAPPRKRELTKTCRSTPLYHKIDHIGVQRAIAIYEDFTQRIRQLKEVVEDVEKRCDEIRREFEDMPTMCCEVYHDNSIYTGEVENGLRNGIGEYVYESSSVYCGYWANGIRNGMGVCTFPSGSMLFKLI